MILFLQDAREDESKGCDADAGELVDWKWRIAMFTRQQMVVGE